ncbi:AAA family ATPase [Haloarcula sp. AONF1]
MNIQSIEITNFKPYRDASAEFTDGGGNIHIVEGDQGAGKTSLLQAVRWALYGADKEINYKTLWNSQAKEDGNEEMSVQLKFRVRGSSYDLERSVDRFEHHNEAAPASLELYTGPGSERDVHPEEIIDSFLPEELSEFFFLDGEQIQNLIDYEDEGEYGDGNATRGLDSDEVQENIEQIIQDTRLRFAINDIRRTINRRYDEKISDAKDEIEEREEKERELEQKKSEIETKKSEISEVKDEIEDVDERIEETEQFLENQQQEKLQRIRDIENEISDLKQKKREKADDLRESWRAFPEAALTDVTQKKVESLKQEIDTTKDDIGDIQKAELMQQAEEGTCPICGYDGDPDPESEIDPSGHGIEEMWDHVVRCRDRLTRLEDAGVEDYTVPSTPASELERIDNRIDTKRADLSELRDEVSAVGDEDDIEQMEDSLESLGQRKGQLLERKSNLEDELDELQDEKQSIDEEILDLANDSELDEVREKKSVAEGALSELKDVRQAILEKKRQEISEEMNEIFDDVAESEFIRNRYSGIQFKDSSDGRDYAIQLVERTTGEDDEAPRDMTLHEPSAGEAQIVALSFIFGLNTLAEYSATIIFDTVAGRLDLTNTEAQAEFFSSLNEPIVLLVTDSELRDLNESASFKNNIGTHHQIKLDDDLNSEISQEEP